MTVIMSPIQVPVPVHFLQTLCHFYLSLAVFIHQLSIISASARNASPVQGSSQFQPSESIVCTSSSSSDYGPETLCYKYDWESQMYYPVELSSGGGGALGIESEFQPEPLASLDSINTTTTVTGRNGLAYDSVSDPILLYQRGPDIDKRFQRPTTYHRKEKLTSRRWKWKESPHTTTTLDLHLQPRGGHNNHECDGFENFTHDIEIVGLKIGIIAFAKTVFAWLLHVINQTYLTYSTYIVGIPERVKTALTLFAPNVTEAIGEAYPLYTQLETLIEVIGLFDYAAILFGSYPLGNWIVIIDGIAEVLTAISLAMAVFAIFSDIFKKKAKKFGIDFEEIFEGYGCNRRNFHYKEKVFENFWSEINDWL